MSKRKVSFGGVTFAPDGKSTDTPAPSHKSASESETPVKMRKNNKIIENNEFNFGTADQRAENQQYVNEKGSRMKTGLHTIDSDDEEENEIQEKKMNYKKLDMDKVKGLEENPEDAFDEDGNMITGFNLKDEMEEGEFDTTGQFHFKKREDTDQWLESVDWKKISKDEKTSKEKMESDDAPPTADDEPDDKLSEKEILEQILTKMRPKETVTKSLQRLGRASTTAIPAWKQKRLEKLQRRKLKSAGKSDTSKYMIDDDTGASEDDLKKMTDFVDHLSRRGYYDIYTDTYEKIKYKISTMETKSQGDDLDMFGEAIDKGEPTGTDVPLEDSETKWEYKVGDDGKIIGPHTTAAMTKLKEESSERDIFCRRVNSNSTFYNIKRVDFDLW